MYLSLYCPSIPTGLVGEYTGELVNIQYVNLYWVAVKSPVSTSVVPTGSTGKTLIGTYSKWSFKVNPIHGSRKKLFNYELVAFT